MPEPTVNVIKRHGFERVSQRHVQFLWRAWLASAHQSLDLRPAVLNRREVGRVGRQPQDLRFDRGDYLLDLTGLMNRQIIQEQNIFRAQVRDQHPTDIRIKDHRINRAFKTERGEQATQAQRPDQRHPFAMIARHALVDSPPTRRAPIRSGHRQMKARFVGEDQTAAIQPGDPATESLPVGFDPLRRRKAFFYAADRVSGAPDKCSRDALALWLFFSDRRLVPRAWRLVARPLAAATRRAVSRLTSPDNHRRAAAVQGSDRHATVSSFGRPCSDRRQKYRRPRRACFRQSHKQVPISLASLLSTPSCVNEWRKSQCQCKRKAL